jgi:hypothetical protein
LVRISAAAALIIDKEVSIASRVFYKNTAVPRSICTLLTLVILHMAVYDFASLTFYGGKALPKVQVQGASDRRQRVQIHGCGMHHRTST